MATFPSRFRAGQPLECLSVAIELEKERLEQPDGTVVLKVGFKVGGGIDQEPSQSPFRYPDTVNDVDFTMVTHDRAVKCIKRNSRLRILIARREIAI